VVAEFEQRPSLSEFLDVANGESMDGKELMVSEES
jgi:hypothetical protein